MIANLLLAALTALLAHYLADLQWELAIFVGWVALRVEAMASTFNLLTGAVLHSAAIDKARLEREQALYEQAVANVASNN